MQRFRDHSCFEQFIKVQMNEMRQYRSDHEKDNPHADQTSILKWISEHARAFREKYMDQHPNDFID